MINIFVTYRCNLACSYCFARELQSEFPFDMASHDFHRLLRWMRHTGVASAAFIGGEPTLHRDIEKMVRETAEAGVAVVLFTNGLFSAGLGKTLAGSVSNVVINYNPPQMYSPSQHALLEGNLARLTELAVPVTLSKNFSPAGSEYGYLIEGARRHGIKAIRYDISRPASTGGNDHYNRAATRELMQHLVTFVRQCEANGIRTGLDCCLKFCELSEADRAFMERVSMKFKGICHPSIDIHPDLSASYCLPMRHVAVADVTAFANSERLMHHFAAAVRSIRFNQVDDACRDCQDFRRKCQGGCLALKQLDCATAERECVHQPERGVS